MDGMGPILRHLLAPNVPIYPENVEQWHRMTVQQHGQFVIGPKARQCRKRELQRFRWHHVTAVDKLGLRQVDSFA